MDAIEIIRSTTKVVPSFRTVNVEIHASEKDTVFINTVLVSWLTFLQLEEVVKTIINKKDVIILVPHRDVTVQELYIDVCRLIFGETGLIEVGAAV